MLVPNRHSSDDYRYGFQGQEKDDEIKGKGNSLNYTFRMHDPRVGRFFAVDPLTKEYPHYTPYSFSGNKVIAFTELEGMEEKSIHIKVSPVDRFVNGLKDMFGMDYFDYHPEDAQTTEATSNLVNKQKDALTRTAKATETIQTANYVMAGMVASPFIIYGTAAGLAYASPFIATEFGFIASSGPYWQSAMTVGGGTGWTMFANGATNLTGQLATNGFKFDDKINLFQPFAAGLTGGVFSNALESSFNVNYSFDKEATWTIGPSKFDDFTSSFIGNYLGGKVGSSFDNLVKPLTDFSSSLTPIFDLYGGSLIEMGENKFSNDLKDKLNSQFSNSDNKEKDKP